MCKIFNGVSFLSLFDIDMLENGMFVQYLQGTIIMFTEKIGVYKIRGETCDNKTLS